MDIVVPQVRFLSLPPMELNALFINENQYQEALSWAIEAHTGQLRWDKKTPYIEHPKAVASMVADRDHGYLLQTIAILHDIVEDCDVEILEVYQKFGSEVGDAVRALTRIFQEPYWEYIKRVSQNYFACIVKIADLQHNFSELPGWPHKNRQRGEKYRMAEAYLRLCNGA